MKLNAYGMVQHAGPPKSPNNIIVRRDVTTSLNAPVISKLLSFFQEAPTYLGRKEDFVTTLNESGERFVKSGEQVVNATVSDLSGWPGLEEGLYLINTGNTGVSSTLLTLAGIYSCCAFGFGSMYRDPPETFSSSSSSSQSGNQEEEEEKKNSLSSYYIPADVAWKTPQFWYVVFERGEFECGEFECENAHSNSNANCTTRSWNITSSSRMKALECTLEYENTGTFSLQ